MNQIDKLANFIMAEIEGEPSENEGAVDTAIRIIKQLQARIATLEAELEWVPVTERLPEEPTGGTEKPILVSTECCLNVMWLFPNTNWKESMKEMGYTHWRPVFWRPSQFTKGDK